MITIALGINGAEVRIIWYWRWDEARNRCGNLKFELENISKNEARSSKTKAPKLKTRNSKLKTRNSKLKTQNSNSKLTTQNSKLEDGYFVLSHLTTMSLMLQISSSTQSHWPYRSTPHISQRGQRCCNPNLMTLTSWLRFGRSNLPLWLHRRIPLRIWPHPKAQHEYTWRCHARSRHKLWKEGSVQS